MPKKRIEKKIAVRDPGEFSYMDALADADKVSGGSRKKVKRKSELGMSVGAGHVGFGIKMKI